MTPEEAVAARVLDISAVTALVGDRVYMFKLPQRGTYPAVRVQLISAPTEYHQRGGLRFRARVQVDALAVEASGVDAYSQVSALADAIHGDDAGSGLSGWVGVIGSPGFEVTGILADGPGLQPEYDPDELTLLKKRRDYWIYFQV